jgi:uncharacterized membrane protein
VSTTTQEPPVRSSIARTLGRVVLGSFLTFTGVSHFTARDAFTAQVPSWMPFTDAVIYVSGVIELALAAGLFFAPAKLRPIVGWALAGFFLLIFPGNISQYVTGTDEFGMATDGARLFRLFLQPVLIVWALWCTGAWATYRASRGK